MKDVVISTPLRLVAALQSGILTLDKSVTLPFPYACVHQSYSVRHLILDEADRMLDSEFISQVQEIVTACSRSQVQKAVFSATLPSGAEKIAMDMMQNPIRVVVGVKYVSYTITHPQIE